MVTVEEGGFGAESAAPANKQILEAYFANQLKKESEKETEEETGVTSEEVRRRSLGFEEETPVEAKAKRGGVG